MSQQKSSVNQITEGVIWKQLLIFFFPILLGSFFQQFYNTIDMVIVGRFVGTAALASVGGSSGQIVQLIVNFFVGLCAGAGVIISQFYGAKDSRSVNESLHTAYAFSILGGLLMMVAGYLFSPALLRVMNTSEELFASSALYLKIFFGGILFTFIYNIGSAILRALGDSRRPVIYLIICSLLNIVLDILMVVVLKLGVAGVAIATVLAQAFSAFLVTRALMKSDDIYKLELRKIKIYPRLLKSELYVGLPGGLQSVMYSASNIIIQAAVNIYGTATTAAWSTYGKLDALFWMISGALGASMTTFAGQNYGAGRYDRIEKGVRICLGIDFLLSVSLSVIMITFGPFLFGIFTVDQELIRIGLMMQRIITPFYAAFMFIEVFSSALRGLSDVLIPTLLTLCGVCLVRIAWITFIVPISPSISMVSYCYPLTWSLTSVLFIIYYFYRKNRIEGFRRLKKS